MKKFSEIGYKIENKRYQEKSKNDIYSFIKENLNVHLSPLNESNIDIDNINVDLDGTNELVEKINKYINDKIIEERIKVLESIKSSIATGTLSLQRINEEIDSCQCTETCPISDVQEEEAEELPSDYFNDYDETEDEYTEIVDTNEGSKVNLSNEFIKLLDEGKADNMNWEDFFNMFNISEDKRTNSLVSSIYKSVKEKRPDLF